MTAKLGCKVKISRILVRNLEKAARKLGDDSLLTNDWKEIVADPSIEIVIEVMGGIHPAKEYILDALKAGKHVVTANKDLIAVHGRELLEAAGETKADFMFEAAVAESCRQSYDRGYGYCKWYYQLYPHQDDPGWYGI